MPTDTLPAPLWVCTVTGCAYTTRVPHPDSTYVTHMPRGLNRTAHPMRRVPSDNGGAEPEGTTVPDTRNSASREDPTRG